jgi:RimJ/RimL family protein N-acetyltransferase
MRFGQQAGYRKITASTHAGQHPARRILKRAGFRTVREDPCQAFGRDLVTETWEWRRPDRRQAEVSTVRSRRTAAGISAALVPP